MSERLEDDVKGVSKLGILKPEIKSFGFNCFYNNALPIEIMPFQLFCQIKHLLFIGLIYEAKLCEIFTNLRKV